MPRNTFETIKVLTREPITITDPITIRFLAVTKSFVAKATEYRVVLQGINFRIPTPEEIPPETVYNPKRMFTLEATNGASALSVPVALDFDLPKPGVYQPIWGKGDKTLILQPICGNFPSFTTAVFLAPENSFVAFRNTEIENIRPKFALLRYAIDLDLIKSIPDDWCFSVVVTKEWNRVGAADEKYLRQPLNLTVTSPYKARIAIMALRPGKNSRGQTVTEELNSNWLDSREQTEVDI